jgi:hypothetical protein
MNLDRLSTGEKIAGVSGLLLFVFTFLDWYHYEQGGNLLLLVILFVKSGNAWETLDLIPFILALTSAAAIGAALLALFALHARVMFAASAAVAVLGAISFLMIVFRIIFPPALPHIAAVPFHATPELGVYLALLAAAGIAFGGFQALWEKRAAHSDLPRLEVATDGR